MENGAGGSSGCEEQSREVVQYHECSGFRGGGGIDARKEEASLVAAESEILRFDEVTKEFERSGSENLKNQVLAPV